MKKIILTLTFVAVAAGARAQTASTTAAATGTLRLTADDAVRLASDNNPGLAADRLDPQIGDTRVAQAASAFTPAFFSTVQRNNQLQPPSSFLLGTEGTRTDTMSSNLGLTQRLPKFGTAYSLGWDTAHVDSNSFLQSFNPTLRSGLNFSLSQPLLRDFTIDAARQQLLTTRVSRDISDTRLREATIQLVADVKRAYWDLVAARALVNAQQTAVDLARELARVNKARVDVGQAPQLDLLSAQAEVAQREEALIVAQTTAKLSEDRLRTLIFPAAKSDMWTTAIEAIDAPPVGLPMPDVDAAISRALDERSDIRRARLEIENAKTAVRYSDNQRLPDVRAVANYQTAGLGGTRLNRTGGFPGTVVPGGDVTPFGSVLDQVFRADYPTWTVGFTLSYPIGRSYDEAGLARARLEEQQAAKRLEEVQTTAVRQIRQAAWQLEMNAKRIDVTRLGRELAEQRLDSEQKRYEVGMSTSFLVIQAQRDLAAARNSELSAQLAYDQSLIDFDAITQAPPAGGGSGSRTAAAPVVAITPTRTTTTSAPATGTIPGGGSQ
jgi:outer membrane protein TolC